MKFLNVYCENRQAEVFISLDKIVLIQKAEEGSEIALEGSDAVKVRMLPEELVRKINGEDKVTIGFRAGR